MKKLLSVSLMCTDLMNVEKDIHILEDNHVDWFHLDVMDAHFVPNLTFGPDFIKQLRNVTDVPFDIHVMLEQPEVLLNYLTLSAKDYVTIHSELPDDEIQKSIDLIKEKGAHVGLAFNPETPVEKAAKFLPQVDLVLLMLVKPGFAGGKMIEGIMDKVAATKKFLQEHGLEHVLISTDGNITVERAAAMAKMGADVFVGGTSAVYRKGMDLKDTIPAFYQAVS